MGMKGSNATERKVNKNSQKEVEDAAGRLRISKLPRADRSEMIRYDSGVAKRRMEEVCNLIND